MRTLDADTFLHLLLRENEFLTRRADKMVSGPEPVRLGSDDLLLAIARLEVKPHQMTHDAIESSFAPLLCNNNVHIENRRAVWHAYSDFRECNRKGSGALAFSDLLVLKLGKSFAMLRRVMDR